MVRRWMCSWVGITLLAVAGCGSSSGRPTSSSAGAGSATAPSSTSSPATASATDGSAGTAVCTKAGGTVQSRRAYWNTNGSESSWLELAGSTTMCRFQAEDGSRIYVDLTTLSSTEPTLAGLAYLSKVPAPSSTSGANPATIYCSKLDASSGFGTGGASGGGWVNQKDPVDKVVSLCVFPDLSFIDEWGLTYHSGGIIRGKDLATVMAYQPGGTLPAVFPT